MLNGKNKNFCCEDSRTVGWARDEIRSMYGLQFGGITLGDVVQGSDDKFENMRGGELLFVSGQEIGNNSITLPMNYTSVYAILNVVTWDYE